MYFINKQAVQNNLHRSRWIVRYRIHINKNIDRKTDRSYFFLSISKLYYIEQPPQHQIDSQIQNIDRHKYYRRTDRCWRHDSFLIFRILYQYLSFYLSIYPTFLFVCLPFRYLSFLLLSTFPHVFLSVSLINFPIIKLTLVNHVLAESCKGSDQ